MWSSNLTTTEAELSLSGVEGEWKLKGEEERARREFAMREWGEETSQTSISEGGQWRLQEAGGDKAWPDKMGDDEDPLAEAEKNFTSLGGGGGQFSDLDSGVCEDLCCDDLASCCSPDTQQRLEGREGLS